MGLIGGALLGLCWVGLGLCWDIKYPICRVYAYRIFLLHGVNAVADVTPKFE